VNTAELPPLVVNGREYPLWSQFVHRKAEWIGGRLQDLDMGVCEETEITDIELEPNGADSACFLVSGPEWGCGFDVKHGGITAGEAGWLTFSGYGGHTWRIQKRDEAKAKPEKAP
jgi:hypothetical protein